MTRNGTNECYETPCPAVRENSSESLIETGERLLISRVVLKPRERLPN